MDDFWMRVQLEVKAKEITVLQSEDFLPTLRKEKREPSNNWLPHGWNSPCTACGKPNCSGPNLGPQRNRADAGSPL
jgi:hypothetical protein